MYLKYHCSNCGGLIEEKNGVIGEPGFCHNCNKYSNIPDSSVRLEEHSEDYFKIPAHKLFQKSESNDSKIKRKEKRPEEKFYNPNIKPSDLNLETANKTIKHAAIAQLVVIAFNLLAAILYWGPINDPEGAVGFLLTFAILLVISILFYLLKSRIAAILFFSIFAIDFVWAIISDGFKSVGGIKIIILIVLYRGIVGAFAYHRLKSNEMPEVMPDP